jgi:hypothetical protein
MTETGIASSLEIARFWGLAPADREAQEWRPPEEALGGQAAGSLNDRGVGARVMDAVSAHVSTDVKAVIDSASGRPG